MARCNGEEDGPSLVGFSDSRLRPHITLYPFLGATIHARRRAQKSAQKFARRASEPKIRTRVSHAEFRPRAFKGALRLPIILPTSELGSFVVDLSTLADWINTETALKSRTRRKRRQRKRRGM